MARRSAWLIPICAMFVGGCVSRQEITRLEADSVRVVCIVEHSAVQTATLDTLREGVSRRGFTAKVIKGNYEKKHSSWAPSWQKADAAGCDALMFYVANWNWDLAYYMYFANIWMTDSTGNRRLAQATYDAGRNVGVGKFIVARDKILELTDQMFSGAKPSQAAPAVSNTVPIAGEAPAPAKRELDAKARLIQLDDLRRQGVVTEQEYAAKRKAILDTL